MPKIGTVLVLIALMVVGVVLIGLALAVLRRARRPRQATGALEARKVRKPDVVGGESDVYERLYGKRSSTVSAPVPVERPPEADVDRSQAGLAE